VFVAGGRSRSEIAPPDLEDEKPSFDANQRHVQLALAGPPSATDAVVLGPPDHQTAPTGHYMLFVLNQSRVPSVARVVRLE
jgi:hypothetical protein